jgi:ATP-dependent helicase/nuclease subunit A
MTSVAITAEEAIEAATRLQRQGADPRLSAWVTASAGSGKTKVLGDRVLRLLLDGTRPERILCLTFTKAAAAEMANRIAETLARWASMPQAKLREELTKLLGHKPSADVVTDARRLFSRVLDAPGGMKIQTIHAFCQSLLRRFPLEAGIAPHFQPMEERDTADQLRAARDAMLLAGQSQRGTALATALAEVQRLGEDRLDKIMGAFRHDHAKLKSLLQRSGSIDSIAAAIARQLEISPNETVATVLDKASRDEAFDRAGLLDAANVLQGGGKTDQARAARIHVWLAMPFAERVSTFEEYAAAFLTAEGEARKQLITKALETAHPSSGTALGVEQQRILRLGERMRAASILVDSRALLTLALDMLGRYEARKAMRAQLDFDDLIVKTRDLLQREGIAPWVLFKLDGGIDHILVDEAQDTNPLQWQVIEALAGEFFSGFGAVDRNRTIFAVGDVKQSIYSFQGADPAGFIRTRAQFETLAGKDNFGNVLLDVSFRSTDRVLDLVDRVFALAAAAPGVVMDEDGPLQHRVSRVGAAGEVRLWPRAVPIDIETPMPWSPPRIRDDVASPVARLAARIAEECQRLIQGEQLHDQGRPVQAGDILILARSRNTIFEAIVRALKARDIPVAGVDRIQLLEQIAVQDLLAFADFLLLPEDDLSLACLLKSPLVGFDEDDLMRLCLDRGEQSLWSCLMARSPQDQAFAAAHDLLSRFLDRADYLTPFALYSDLLAAAGGRRKIYGRLGLEASDAVDEFMALAQAYEQQNTPSLQGFAHWLRTTDAEVKRETQERADQVRIMTIHGAKGLQAPIVFLVDQQRRAPGDDGLFWIDAGGAEVPLWSPRKAADHPVTAAARQRREQTLLLEENRLLYVALTRAEDRLYVCGIGSGLATTKLGWYDHVAEAMQAIPDIGTLDLPQMPGDGWSGPALRVSSDQRRALPLREAVVQESVGGEITLPDWANHTAPDEPDPPQPLTPSRPTPAEAAAEPALVSPLAADQGYRFKRGRLIHHLLETLPNIASADRVEAATGYLARPVHGLTEVQRQEIGAEVMAVLDHPDFAPLFGPQSQAEVPVVATLTDPEGRSRILAGQIDRLALVGDDCLIVDYKSNRPPPMQVSQVPLPYLRQMAAYRSAIRLIYPGKTVRCLLLWSDGPRLMELPADMLNLHG